MTAPVQHDPVPAQRAAASTTTWVRAPHVVVLRVPDPAAAPGSRASRPRRQRLPAT